jgi:hypothetical protein
VVGLDVVDQRRSHYAPLDLVVSTERMLGEEEDACALPGRTVAAFACGAAARVSRALPLVLARGAAGTLR